MGSDPQPHRGAVVHQDLGCCVGFFCVSAAADLGMTTFGYDVNERYVRIARLSVPHELRSRCNIIQMPVDPQTVDLLPATDVTLCLSIWHHWVRSYGFEAATAILRTIWQTTSGVLVFESGEEETREEFNLPFPALQPAKDWLHEYLAETSGEHVEQIGAFPAGSYSHYRERDHQRTLFKVTRRSSSVPPPDAAESFSLPSGPAAVAADPGERTPA